jgi:hypothetical protein
MKTLIRFAFKVIIYNETINYLYTQQKLDQQQGKSSLQLILGESTNQAQDLVLP